MEKERVPGVSIFEGADSAHAKSEDFGAAESLAVRDGARESIPLFLSVVITTYNRAAIVPRAVRSALDELKRVSSYEVIVVDDASTDNTIEVIQEIFSDEIFSGRVKLLRNATNRGVTGSKNEGYLAAGGSWVIFLDSDDTLLQGVGEAMVSTLDIHSERSLVFFRCVDQIGNFVGTRFEKERLLDLETYLKHTSFGEALTAVNKNIVKREPYIASLRGYEGLGCCRIIECHGAAVLSTVVARCYDLGVGDRLSVSASLFRRMPLLARGHLMLVHEFGERMRWGKVLGYLMKALVYGVAGGVYRCVERVSK
ncbi:MAG: glycosyltransferase family 2 protein [Candidatus Manganitrophus sp.]|nr:glycosyltransferase family 2 protein [Candidatus Manganitrophus sp.]MDC4226491.1 glycosyltransferase family 2 protein [Candidatus Manganitrophus sp.]WDT72318.1 MAG: glycosyltransferase family 2 protein [Candidatus Manganitrophus sp.]WDT75440.1 MAG: glycosyltransferase family 2 protein [Candidatus Manganitrophus sp.]WDT80245.1 MAG: glycosyltransferase family 2 protein [Candidatus Manganitrophus sp.]